MAETLIAQYVHHCVVLRPAWHPFHFYKLFMLISNNWIQKKNTEIFNRQGQFRKSVEFLNLNAPYTL